MQAERNKNHFSLIEYGLIFLCFFVCLTGALFLPVNQCPDEIGRNRLIDWMVEQGTLPTGDELEPMGLNPPPGVNYGFSYALRPYLPAMVGAFFVKAAAIFTDSPRILRLAARMCSVLSVSGCCWFCLRTGRRIFERRSSAILFAVIVCFLPQVLFLGMYHNNDAPSLFAVSMMIYFFIDGYDQKWPVRSCVGLAMAFSIGLLTYYSIYGWILMTALACVLSVVMDRGISGKGILILKRAGLIVMVCLLFAGWFFIRAAILHDGDFLGIAYEEVSRARVEALGYRLYAYECYRQQGLTILEFLRFRDYEWLRITVRSFFGAFGNMEFYFPMLQYRLYYSVVAFGMLLFIAVLLHQRPSRRDGLLMMVMFVSSGINVALHFWQSYARDYQPQGRYIISVILALGFIVAYGLDHTSLCVRKPEEECSAVLHPAVVLTVFWLLLSAWAILGTMPKMGL